MGQCYIRLHVVKKKGGDKKPQKLYNDNVYILHKIV